ncbi:hypothetical protein [Alishewanella longhuensis]
MLYEQNNATATTFFNSLLQLVGHNNQVITLSDQQQDILIKFELNHQAIISKQQGFFYFLLLVPFGLCVLPIFMIKASIKRQYQQANHAIKQAIESFLVNTEHVKADLTDLPAEFSIRHCLAQTGHTHKTAIRHYGG